MADTNKVKLGLKSCYYAPITFAEGTGAITYGTPVAFPGAVSLSLDAQGNETENFYADDIIYYAAQGANGGYQGDFEVAKVIDSFHTDILGDKTDKNGLIVEDADAPQKEFALLCQFTGDKHATRHVLYRCTATRPSFGSQTKEETATPITETITITAIPANVGGGNYVKAKATPDASNYDQFFTTVQLPSFNA